MKTFNALINVLGVPLLDDGNKMCTHTSIHTSVHGQPPSSLNHRISKYRVVYTKTICSYQLVSDKQLAPTETGQALHTATGESNTLKEMKGFAFIILT